MSPPEIRVLVLTAFGPEADVDERGELGRWLEDFLGSDNLFVEQCQ